MHAVDQAEVDDVDAELGVDHVAHGLLDVLDVGAVPVGCGCGLTHALSSVVLDVACAASAWAVASFQAIQPSSAHLMRAGILRDAGERDGVLEHLLVGLDRSPLDCIRARNSS